MPTDLPRQLSSSNRPKRCCDILGSTQVLNIPLSSSTISILKYFLSSLTTLFTANHHKGISTSLILLKEWNSVIDLQMLRYDVMSTIYAPVHIDYHDAVFSAVENLTTIIYIRTQCGPTYVRCALQFFSRYPACYPTLCLYPALC